MWPNSPAIPLAPRYTRLSMHQRAADAGAQGHAEHEAVTPAGAEAALGDRCGVGVVVDHHRQPDSFGDPRAQRLAPPVQVRGEHDDGAGDVDEPGSADARPPRRRAVPAKPVDDVDDRVLDRFTSWPSVGRRSSAITVPAESTTAPSTLVPPMSMPMVSGSQRDGRTRGVTTSDMGSD